MKIVVVVPEMEKSVVAIELGCCSFRVKMCGFEKMKFDGVWMMMIYKPRKIIF